MVFAARQGADPWLDIISRVPLELQATFMGTAPVPPAMTATDASEAGYGSHTTGRRPIAQVEGVTYSNKESGQLKLEIGNEEE